MLVVTFAVGLLAGAALDRLWLRERESGRASILLARPPEEDGIPDRLKDLGLSPEQQRAVRGIAARWRPRSDSVLNALVPAVRDLEYGMFQEMMCVLTPAQDSAYLAWRAARHLNEAEGHGQLSLVTSGKCPAP